MMKNEKKKFEIRKCFLNPDGKIRAGWLALISVLLYSGISLGIRTGLRLGFAGLFGVWNVNEGNIRLAPGWAQMIYIWHGSFITVTVCIVLLGISRILRRIWLGTKRIPGRPLAGIRPLLAGMGIAVVSSAFFVLADCMRLERPLTEPELSFSLPIMFGITLLTAWAEEAFNKGVVFDGICARWGKMRAVMVSCILFFFTNGGYAGNIACAVNVFLMGAICCGLYERGGVWASACFRCGWSFASVFVAGFEITGAAQSVYTLYSVSESWITGGDGGMIYGLWMTTVFTGIIAWMCRKTLRDFLRTCRKRKIKA